MHFAAQFRAATGLRPHDYVVRRRIEKAQELLRDGSIPLAQVALGVGFQTQAHFTTVFRDQVHETPGRWRQLHQAS
jgi:AraC-like DNA-binding protein